MRQPVLMHERPNRPIIGLKPTFGQLSHQAAQGKITLSEPGGKPNLVFTPDRARTMPAHLARRDSAGFSETADPFDCRARSYIK